MNSKILAFEDLGVRPEDVYEQMGYGGAAPGDDVAAEVQQLLHQAAGVARPQYAFVVVHGTLAPRHLELVPQLSADGWAASAVSTLFNIGSIIGRQLKGSEAFAIFVATAGVEYEAWRHQDDLVRTYMADALGSVIAEKCADRMEQALQASIDKLHWQHTNRFSPGYCGWHVSEQQRLFGLFGVANPCGVRLMESSLMVPIKSVSGVVGLGTAVRRLDYTCGLCDFQQCFRRHRPTR